MRKDHDSMNSSKGAGSFSQGGRHLFCDTKWLADLSLKAHGHARGAQQESAAGHCHYETRHQPLQQVNPCSAKQNAHPSKSSVPSVLIRFTSTYQTCEVQPSVSVQRKMRSELIGKD